MKKLEKRVRNPRAKKMPPKNSDNPADHANTDAAGKPISPVLVMNCSDGGSFPYPCPNAIATPANILNNVNPAFAAYDNPDSPPKSMLLSKPLNLPQMVYFAEKEWHNLGSMTTTASRSCGACIILKYLDLRS